MLSLRSEVARLRLLFVLLWAAIRIRCCGGRPASGSKKGSGVNSRQKYQFVMNRLPTLSCGESGHAITDLSEGRVGDGA